jgi:hypothetical protein
VRPLTRHAQVGAGRLGGDRAVRRAHESTLEVAAPTIHRIELEFQGFAYDYERVALPLAAGGGLPPMVLTFIACSIPRSRRFWERYAAG